MFRLLFLRNGRTLRNFLWPKRLQKPSFNGILWKSTIAKHKNIDIMTKAAREVFFPPVKLNCIKDRVALVTGGVSGIGRLCVRELLNCGAKGVMIADTNEDKGLNKVVEFAKEYGEKRVAFIQIHPGNYMFLKNAFINTMQFFKGLDIVVNNIRFKEQHWEDQVDEYVKGVVLITQLSLEFMGKNNGGRGGVLVNVSSDYREHTESCPLFLAVQDFIVKFDRAMAAEHYTNSDVKVLTICKATPETIKGDLSTVIAKGNNGCVFMP